MRPVYYFDEVLGYCPVKKYLEQYAPNIKEQPKQRMRKLKLLDNIVDKIRFVVDRQGAPTPPISFPLDKDYDYFEIKHRKNKNIVIRIFYFRHHDKIVLLNALDKPDNYDTGKENRRIDKQLQITQGFQNKFKNNPSLYEEYN